ncbi:MAG: hypothetical protein ACXWDS_03895 [Actinomycetota bacterium]
MTVIQPNITHPPCDLDQQRKRHEARRDSVARAVAWRGGRRSVLDRVLRLRAPVGELSAEDLRHGESEDVYHSLRV